MGDAGFARWLAELEARYPVVSHGDGQIFVPGQTPRLARRFVEIEDADEAKVGA